MAVSDRATAMVGDEASCLLCGQHFTGLECGHSFCQGCCITQNREKWEADPEACCCPQCGEEVSLKRKLTPDLELGKVVEKRAKMVKGGAAERASGQQVCATHQQPLSLFCKGKQRLMCFGCTEEEEEEEEASESVLPLEEAAQGYREDLDSLLKAWKEKREETISFHTQEKERYDRLQAKVHLEKQKIVSKFEEVEVFLKQHKTVMLDQLEELAKKEEAFVTKISSDVYLCDILIKEMENKRQQPPSVFLEDIEKTLQRCKVADFQQPSICSELEDKVHSISKKYIILQYASEKLKEYLTQELDVNLAEVTLDPDTAHRRLRVSADQKTLSWLYNSCNPTDHPQRFSPSFCALGCEGFTSGRHYWEVEVGPARMGDWAVGVARESIKRKENIFLSKLPEGIWALSKQQRGNLTGCYIPQKIGIYLDYEGNRVVFFNADNNEGTVLHNFSSAPFKQEKIRPFFMLKYELFQWSSTNCIPPKLRICK